MTDLVDFLHARIAEDEQIARSATCEPWTVVRDGYREGEIHTVALYSGYVGDENPEAHWVVTNGDFHEAVGRADAEHIAHHDPARELREVEAKRQRLNYLVGLQHDLGPEDFVTFHSCRILAKPGELGDLEVGYCSCGLDAMRLWLYKIEAMPYVDHPSFKEEWRA